LAAFVFHIHFSQLQNDPAMVAGRVFKRNGFHVTLVAAMCMGINAAQLM
jgi:hypothetical protein